MARHGNSRTCHGLPCLFELIELRQTCTPSRLSNWLIATDIPGDGPWNTTIFWPAATRWPPDAFIKA